MPSEVKRLRQLEEENPKRSVADLSLDEAMLQDVRGGDHGVNLITPANRNTYRGALDLSLKGSVHEDIGDVGRQCLPARLQKRLQSSSLPKSSSRKRKIRRWITYAKLFVRVSPGSYNGITDSFAEAFLPPASTICTSRLGTAWPGLT